MRLTIEIVAAALLVFCISATSAAFACAFSAAANMASTNRT